MYISSVCVWYYSVLFVYSCIMYYMNILFGYIGICIVHVKCACALFVCIIRV